METISILDLRVFLEVDKALSVTRAAAKMGTRKAAVSKGLARLEQQLGVRLFERSTRRLAITRAGITLRARAEALLADVANLVTDVRRDEQELGGKLCVAAPPELGTLLTAPLCAAYLAAHPRVNLTLKLSYGYHDLFEPEIDLAFRIGTVKDDNLVARKLGTFARVLVASPAFVEKAGPKQVEELERLPCLAFDEREARASWVLADSKGVRSLEVGGRFAARSYSAILAAACAGLGIAFLPSFVVQSHLERGELRRVLPAWSSPPQQLFVAYRVGQSRVQRVAAFLELLEAHPEWMPCSRSKSVERERRKRAR